VLLTLTAELWQNSDSGTNTTICKMDQATDNPGAGETVAESELDRIRQAAGLNSRQHWCELSPDAMICLDGRWRVLFFNRAADELFQASGMLAVGQPPWQCAPLLGILEELSLDSLSAEPRVQRCMVRQVELGKAGTRALEAAVAVAGAHDERVFTICIRDVSQKAPAQPTLYQSQRRQLVGSLAGGIAHDFNNILTAVICQIDLALLDKELSQQARESLMQAMESARRGAELNAKLLQFSRNTEARPTAVQLTRLVDETVFLLRRGIDRRIGIQFAAPGSDLWPAWVDEGQFMQVLMSLSLNARDAMPKGGELLFQLANLKLGPEEARAPRRSGEFVQITVSDTGHGMTPEVLGRLFEPYFTTKEFGKGAGLGLSIANHVVVEHGGWMEVDSEPGRGSRFHVFLPRAVTATAPPAEPAGGGAAVGTALEGDETVLVVDDEQPVREVIRAMLAFRGYQVVEAGDGTEAVDRFRAANGDIDLVLLDIQMPRMNGWDTLEKLHKLDSEIPVLLLSGGVSEPPADRIASSRPAAVLQKPFASAELLRMVRKILDSTRRPG
jgi:two-component system cell cycle sensor histidine kinase/response regulator CckA